MALAWLTAIALATPISRWPVRGRSARLPACWSDASYGVFLIHYAVIVAPAALWLRLGAAGTAVAWGLLVVAWAASLLTGAALQRAFNAR